MKNLPTVSDAKLPQSYEHACTALATCEKIDECKEWADKAAALASYAKQAEDLSLENYAKRIKARAIRRAGELLNAIEPKHGANQNIEGGSSPKVVTRKQAARDAGLSPDQQKQAQRVANVPQKEFDEQVESDSPPTISNLAIQGTHRTAVTTEQMRKAKFGLKLQGILESLIAVRDEYGTKEIDGYRGMELLDDAYNYLTEVKTCIRDKT